MSQPAASYVFQSPSQWAACLFRGVGSPGTDGRAAITPALTYSIADRRDIAAPGARAPVRTPAREMLWHDQTTLARLACAEESPARQVAPWALVRSPRMIATSDALWVVGTDASTLECFDLVGLTRRRVIDFPGARILDLAAGKRRHLMLLVQRVASDGTGRFEIVTLNPSGESSTVGPLNPVLAPVQLTYLKSRRDAPALIVLLSADGASLHVLEEGATAARRSLRLGERRPCFAAHCLASDGRSTIAVAGRDGSAAGNTPRVLVLDRDLLLVDDLQLSAPATGLAAGPSQLIVSTDLGVSVYTRSTLASATVGSLCELMTPLLRAPDSDADITWQRADAWATLPLGTTLELRYGWTDNPDLQQTALRMTADARLPQAERLARLENLIDHWSAPVVVSSTGASAVGDAADLAAPVAFPLLDARVPQLWLHLVLRAAPGASLPSLTRLCINYGGSPLLQQLPAVHRRSAIRPGDFLGTLVGVLEATTQDLDRRIGALGTLVQPDLAPSRWLDQLADWLGLPWDDALSVVQKRAVLKNASALISQRGTRAGLATLLACLFPGEPPPFRITDVDVDFGFMILGCAGSTGSRLPAVLAGLPPTASVLSRKTILGSARLPCTGELPSATRPWSGVLRIDLAVSARERQRCELWLPSLLEAMVPATLRLRLRWYAAKGPWHAGMGELPAALIAELGTGAILGRTHLPETGVATLSS